MTIKMARINGVWLWEVRDREGGLIAVGSEPDFYLACLTAHAVYRDNTLIPYKVLTS